MQLPMQITFRNMESSENVKDWIREEAGKLETFYQPIMGCRVAVEVPHRHRRNGAAYGVRIDLTLPGGEIVVKRAPTLAHRLRQVKKTAVSKQEELDAPRKNLRLAINRAFQAASRRLQEYARKQRREVKRHEPAPVARVGRIFREEGYGFLTAPDGRDIYFHQDSVLNGGFRRLKVGTVVHFAEEKGEKGPQASTVRLAGKRDTRHFVEAVRKVRQPET
ncbi:MAG: HPF/RaiA family ribosome-associated protein [Acidobacteriota bacterium]|nr:HPF/RaiA family ribosome-associated protein [Acidobacteriota bacterium]MDE3170552.1 HPF/RaiA family ribosome-associated protein [Acidobacteriota bacterium]